MEKPQLFDEAFLDRVRDQTDLSALISADVKLRRAGKRFVGCCPFHAEKTASFNVDPVRNTYRCYGCSARGDAISWMMNQHRMNFPEAIAYLAQRAGIEMPTRSTADGTADSERRKRLARLYRLLERALSAYQAGLKSLPASKQYLESRGVSEAIAARFELGAVASGILPCIRGFTRDELVASGVACVRDDGGEPFDRFRSRVIFPIHNAKGNVVSFAGRSLMPKPDRTPKYLNGPETELFCKSRELYGFFQARDAIRKSRVCVVVEGYLDVIQAHQAGDCRVVGTMGTAITEQQLAKLFREVDLVVFAFDGDRAGFKAALRAAAELLGVVRDGQQAKFLFLPKGEDPDSFIRKNGLDAWLSAVESAMQLSQYLGEFVAHRLDRCIPETQVAAAERARKVLARVKHAVIFRLALRLRFEELIGIPLE